MEGFVCKKENKKGLFWKRVIKGWGLLIKKEKGQGAKGKTPFFNLTPEQNRGGGQSGGGGRE